MTVNWGGSFSEVVASIYRPVIALVCGFAVAVCCFVPATALVAIPCAAGLAGGAGVLRTIDKKTAAAPVAVETAAKTG